MSTIDTTPSTVATSALQSMPFGNLIGGPLSACIEAQAKAAKTSWEFIRDVGLTSTDDGGQKAIYVSFEYRKDGRSMTLSLPLLTIVPIPYIAIHEINIAFKASISASASTSKTEHKSLALETGMKAKTEFNALVASGSIELSASVSSKKDSTATRDSKYSVEYTMDVSVKAGQDDMPAGMAKVLEMLSTSIDSVDTKGELHVSDQVVSLAAGVVLISPTRTTPVTTCRRTSVSLNTPTRNPVPKPIATVARRQPTTPAYSASLRKKASIAQRPAKKRWSFMSPNNHHYGRRC